MAKGSIKIEADGCSLATTAIPCELQITYIDDNGQARAFSLQLFSLAAANSKNMGIRFRGWNDIFFFKRTRTEEIPRIVIEGESTDELVRACKKAGVV